ncbi:putative ribonuclease H-like domain-containing protein [Tanacetum coccineum]
METNIQVSPTPTLRINKDHPKSQIIGPIDTPVQTRHKAMNMKEQSFIATIHQKTNPDLLQYCLFSCFLSQEEPKKFVDALKDPSWVEAMQEELLYAFLYGTIDEEVYVMQPPGFQDSEFLNRVYKVVKAMYGLHQAPRAWYGTLSKYLLDNGFQRGTIDQTLFIRKYKGEFLLVQVVMGELTFFFGLQVLQNKDGIFLSQDKYVADILNKFRLSDVMSAKTPMDREHPWGKDGAGKDVELHLYRSIIGSLMYLTASRPDIMFTVCVCVRHQVTPKECHLHAVKRIFRYLKGHPKLGLWNPKESPFDLVAYSDSDYGGANQDRKSTTRGCQFLGRRLISWQCKKQTIVATSTTEAEYVATGDLRMVFDPNEEDDIWINQQYWELLRWKLHESSGVHSLFLDGTSIQINMLVEKKYPLKKEVLEKMINLKLDAEEESIMAIELLQFIKSHIEEQSFGDSRPPVARKPKFSKLADTSGSGDSRVEPIKEEEEKVAEVAATTETKDQNGHSDLETGIRHIVLFSGKYGNAGSLNSTTEIEALAEPKAIVIFSAADFADCEDEDAKVTVPRLLLFPLLGAFLNVPPWSKDDAGQAIITLFEQAMATKEDLKKQYTECKDISPERRAMIEKCLDDEAWKDYEVM